MQDSREMELIEKIAGQISDAELSVASSLSVLGILTGEVLHGLAQQVGEQKTKQVFITHVQRLALHVELSVQASKGGKIDLGALAPKEE